MLSGWSVCWLLFAAAAVVFGTGLFLRWFVGRAPSDHLVRRFARAVRWSVIGRVIFGPITRDTQGNSTFDDDELDQMIVGPTLVLASAFFLTGAFLMGYLLVNQ
ncbi:hypothetical protein [Mycolicibacter arupensis]|uniref:hypothetical protein n=1 Tax=Mycolicibacter arupensis TaxID=342002 RepID=UPI00122C593E|nr:hypothetical protein [Mycolicibacter arupensis]KAA1428159.1 hypothetical protein F0402_19745 [Mycolicibacter arupensis]